MAPKSLAMFWTLALCLMCVPFSVLSSPLDLEVLDPRQTVSVCPRGAHMIVGPGKGAAVDPTETKNGRLQSLINLVKQQIPGTDNAKTLRYDLSQDNATIVAQATNDMRLYTEQFAASCPTTPIIILGFSIGGIAAMNVFCGGISNVYNRNVIAINLYGQETWQVGKPYDRGTCQQNSPTFRDRGSMCRPYSPLINSYCDAIDPLCCTGGTDRASHKTYPDRYDGTSIDFIKGQYARFRMVHPV